MSHSSFFLLGFFLIFAFVLGAAVGVQEETEIKFFIIMLMMFAFVTLGILGIYSLWIDK